jgi:hypothetical protein
MRRLVLACALALSGCGPETNSPDAFEREPARAEQVIDDCDAGRRRGQVCDDARLGAARAASARRMEQFRKGF